MKRELLLTSDGSHTVSIPDKKITYHSIHGALQESRHVFIEAGLNYVLSKYGDVSNECIRIFEMGFGTGLNALLSFAAAKEKNRCICYRSAELYPLSPEEAKQLNYISAMGEPALAQPFLNLHECAWNEEVAIAPFFTLYKLDKSIMDNSITQLFHLIYFDAFAPDVQPELWTLPVFRQMYNGLYPGGALVTYCSKGSVRRNLQEAGFTVEKLKGPPGKREMVRAVKH